MKKLLTLLLIFPLFIACSDSDNDNEPIILTSITLNEIDKELNIGDEYQMSVITKPDMKNINVFLQWNSSDTKVATISKTGKLKVLSDGVTEITASYGNLSSSVYATINKIQDYTSFVFVQTVDNDLPNCIVAYLKDGQFYKIADLGTINIDNQSQEIKITDKNITDIYFFTDYISTRRFDYIYKLKDNKKNIFRLTPDVKGLVVTNKSDPTQYPQ